MKQVMKECRLVTDLPVTVLLTGETGTGKDVLARYIHYTGRRGDAPFIPVNCSSFPGELIESQLFGYEKGAFNDAIRDKEGLFKAADKGTLFLDEINKTSLKFQQTLLRALESKQIRPLGSTAYIPVDVRVIAAANKDLLKLAKEGLYLEDLYYRLDQVSIRIPPLRERREDIPPLAEYFIRQFSQELDKDIHSIPENYRKQLLKNSWPGNVRELKSFLLKAVIRSENGILQPLLASKIKRQDLELGPCGRLLTMVELEETHIKRALEQTNNNVTQAARLLKMPRTTLQKRIIKYKININL